MYDNYAINLDNFNNSILKGTANENTLNEFLDKNKMLPGMIDAVAELQKLSDQTPNQNSRDILANIQSKNKENVAALQKSVLQLQSQNKTFKNIIKDITSPGMHKGIIEVLEQYIDVSKKVHSITKEERKKIIHIIKALPLTIEGLAGFDKAVIADGGLLLTEIDMKTMRSRKINNLLVTGDIIDINRPSGGYSLMLCWTTGYIAGCSVSS
jgi:predicted flavoprotein YhiN